MQLPIPVIKLLADFVDQEQAQLKMKSLKRRERLKKIADKCFPNTIILGRGSPVITNPTTKDSEYIKDADKDESVIKEAALRRIRWRRLNKKRKTKVIIRRDMSKGEFPRTDEIVERLEHCKKAMRELNAHALPATKAKVRKILRTVRRVSAERIRDNISRDFQDHSSELGKGKK